MWLSEIQGVQYSVLYMKIEKRGCSSASPYVLKCFFDGPQDHFNIFYWHQMGGLFEK